MKIIDAMPSLDGKQVIFAFTADGRIDFRDLVKNLSLKFKKSIRMQQIGSRDEASASVVTGSAAARSVVSVSAEYAEHHD